MQINPQEIEEHNAQIEKITAEQTKAKEVNRFFKGRISIILSSTGI